MSARAKAPRDAGFTLLELLLGLALLGALLILVYSALHIGIRAWDSGDARATEASHQRIVQAFLRRELGQVFPIRWRGIAESRIAFEGTSTDVKFVTSLNLGGAVREGGLQWGHLYVADDIDDAGGARTKALFLKREVFDLQAKDWTGLDDAKPTRLVKGIKDLQISYFGNENDNTDPTWRDEWNFPLRIPTLVKIVIHTESGRDAPELVVALKLGEEAGCYDTAFQRQCGARRA